MPEERLEITRPADAHRGGREGVFDDHVPPDEPRQKLAERRVGVGVSGAGHRGHCRELRVTKRRKHAGDARHNERHDQRRAGLVVGRRADDHENARANDRADREAGQPDRSQHAAKPVLALDFRVDLVKILSSKQLAHGVDSSG